MPGTKIQNETLLKFMSDKYFYDFKENAGKAKEQKHSFDNYIFNCKFANELLTFSRHMTTFMQNQN